MAPSKGFIDNLRGRIGNIGELAVANTVTSFANSLYDTYGRAGKSIISDKFSGMRNTDYEEQINSARSALVLGSTYGLAMATKFASDAYTYGTIPAIRIAGLAAGKYGYIISEYLNTKEQFKQQYKMLGMQLGVTVGGSIAEFATKYVGGGLIKSGIITLGTAAAEALTGLGIVAAIPTAIVGLLQVAAGWLTKLIVGGAVTAGSGYVGAKVGEKIGDMYGDKYSNINLGTNMMKANGDTVAAWKASMPYLVSREGSLAYDNLFPIAEKLDRGAGMNLDYLVSDNIDKLKYATDFSKGYAGKDVEGLAGYSMMLDNISGSDMGSAIKAYSASSSTLR